MTDAEVLAALSDRQALALTIYGEARGDTGDGGSSVEERIAVGCVIRNRVHTPHRFGDTYRAVCLQRSQFSCWSSAGGAANAQHVLALARLVVGNGPGPSLFPADVGLLAESEFLADGLMGGQLLDRVRGATQYYAPAAMIPRGRVPTWAIDRAPVAQVGGHVFFVGV